MSAQAVLQAVDEQRLVRLARDLVRIPSLTRPGQEGPVAAYLAEYLSRAGLAVEMQEVEPGRPNLIATLKGVAPGRRLILNGHTDVVPPGETGWTDPPFAGAVRDGRLYGRGAVDMKGPIASLVEALLAVKAAGAPFRGEVALTLVVGEEDGQHGIRHLIEAAGLRGDWGIVAEPTELKPVICHKGLVTATVTTLGRSCHASRPHEGVNAIDQMSRVLIALQELRARLAGRAHPILGPPTLSAGTMRAGELTNMVPDRCVLTVDRRVLPGEEMDQVVGELAEMLGAIAASDPTFQFTLEAHDRELPMEISAESPVVTAVRRATEQVLGADPGVHGWSATCDANVMVNAGGIPTVIYGPGSISQAHQPDEFVELDQLFKAARVYALAILGLLG